MQWDESERNTSEKSSYQTSPNWRENLPRLEGALFHGLGAWRINFFYFRNHFLKIHTRGIPKMSNFYVFGPFLAEKTAVKEKKARFDPFVPPTHFQQQVGWGTRLTITTLKVIVSLSSYFFYPTKIASIQKYPNQIVWL